MSSEKSGNESISLTGPIAGQGGTAGHLPAGYSVREFQIERVLGEGGFSVVYLATDTRLERQVAIKEYMPTALATRNPDLSVHVRSSAQHREAFDAGLRSFINEAKLLARFEHRALVKVHQFWQEKGTAYMVMPYYSGPTLKSWIKQQHDPVDPVWLEQFLRLVMDALETLHKENCLHRDVAPDNILILNERSPLLLDFGAARRVIGDLTQALTVILKPGFAPIEQYAESNSMRQGPWTDVYALCAVAHFMITGRAPTPSVTRVLADDLVPLRTLAEGRFPPAFLTALDAGLTVRPQQRPQSIGALRDLMNGAPLDDTLTARPGDEAALTMLSPGSVPATVRPMPFLGEADDDDDEKTRIVSAADLPLTGPSTISSPSVPAIVSIEAETAPEMTGDPSFESRFPSRSMREHESAFATPPAGPVRAEAEDKESRLPLILGVLAILLVIGIAWAVINWLNDQMVRSRRPVPPPPTVAPVPAPSSSAPPPLVAVAPPPAAAAAPPAVTPPPAAEPAIAAGKPEPKPDVTAPVREPIEVQKVTAAAPVPHPAAESAKPDAPAATAPAKSRPVPTPAPAVAAANAPTKAAPPPVADARPSSSPSNSPSKGGPPMTESARPRPPASQPTSTTYGNPPPLLSSATAPPVSVPSVATVDAGVPPPMAAAQPSQKPPMPTTVAPLKPTSKPRPMFPREAVRAGVDKGRVSARIFVASDGSVSKVDILDAYPAHIFDRTVRETAMRWRFEAPGQTREADVEFVFDRFKDR